MHGLKSGSCRFWQRTDLQPGFNILRAEIQRALRRAPRQLRRLRLGLQTRRGSNHSTAHVGESNSRSNVVQIRRASACVPSRWKVLSGEFRRRPTALAVKFRKPDRVGRRGLSEPREDFSRLLTYPFPWLDSVADSVDSRLHARLLEPLHFHFHLQQYAAQFLQLDHR
ncbi:MAG: hypothetical protein RL692_342 [Planctomycetota bacterium]